jgi:hypothetical protein
MTNSFRADSRLTSMLEGECSFVYFSPYYFAGERERNIYEKCSQANLDAFYSSINSFDAFLKEKLGTHLHIYKQYHPVEYINSLVNRFGFDRVVIDQTLFGMWWSVDISKISVPVTTIDSSTIDPHCTKMTAKSRWMSHVSKLASFVPNKFSDKIVGFDYKDAYDTAYPQAKTLPLIDAAKVLAHAHEVAPTYGETRDRHDGQTRTSTALHNGVIDPANLFYEIANQFKMVGVDLSSNETAAAAMLRQFAFREISIIQARRHRLTLENEPQVWAQKLMHFAAYDNLIAARNDPKSKLSWETISTATTGDRDLDFLLRDLIKTGIMPNRARMFYASRVFYSAKSGVDALNLMVDTFDLLGLDGQSPNNYTQCVGALGLSYGKVLKMNRDTAWAKLAY